MPLVFKSNLRWESHLIIILVWMALVNCKSYYKVALSWFDGNSRVRLFRCQKWSIMTSRDKRTILRKNMLASAWKSTLNFGNAHWLNNIQGIQYKLSKDPLSMLTGMYKSIDIHMNPFNLSKMSGIGRLQMISKWNWFRVYVVWMQIFA